MAIERQYSCWKEECAKEKNLSNPCNRVYFDCDHVDEPGRDAWLKQTQVLANCVSENSPINFTFGMYGPAFAEGVTSAPFFEKYFFCFWFGLKSLRYTSSHLISSHISNYVNQCLFPCTFCYLQSQPPNMDFAHFGSTYLLCMWANNNNNYYYFASALICLKFMVCSSYGQNLETSTSTGETLYGCGVCLGGLVIFCLLIGNMQV